MIRLPQVPGPAKPRPMAPCNGCGYCCQEEVCAIGLARFGDVPAPCPGMVFRDGHVRCGVILQSTEPGRLMERLAVGRGCDADDPWDYEKERFDFLEAP